MRSAMPYSARLGRLAPKVLVSTASAPAVEVGVVDGADHVGPGDVEDLVAALEALEVVERQVRGLQHGAHRAVGDDDPFGEGVAESRVSTRVRLHVSSSATGAVPHGSRCGVAIRHSRPRGRTLAR